MNLSAMETFHVQPTTILVTIKIQDNSNIDRNTRFAVVFASVVQSVSLRVQPVDLASVDIVEQLLPGQERN
jgi:hypothetical protein